MNADSIRQLDQIIAQSLTSLAHELSQGHWKGRREREVVSLFCFGHLLRQCAGGSVLYDPAQISIEVAVPQIRGQKNLAKRATSKAQVYKDIVLWPRPRMVAWDEVRKATVPPMSILEWKHNERVVSDYDVKWLRRFSSQNRPFVGYAVRTNHPAKGFTLSCTRVALGQSAERWLYLG